MAGMDRRRVGRGRAGGVHRVGARAVDDDVRPPHVLDVRNARAPTARRLARAAYRSCSRAGDRRHAAPRRDHDLGGGERSPTGWRSVATRRSPPSRPHSCSSCGRRRSARRTTRRSPSRPSPWPRARSSWCRTSRSSTSVGAGWCRASRHAVTGSHPRCCSGSSRCSSASCSRRRCPVPRTTRSSSSPTRGRTATAAAATAPACRRSSTSAPSSRPRTTTRSSRCRRRNRSTGDSPRSTTSRPRAVASGR